MKSWLLNSLRQAAWAPLLVFGFYAVAAKGFHAYLQFPWLDMPTHLAGGMAITWFFRASIAHAEPVVGPIPHPVQRLLAIGLTAIAAVIWEFLEFFSDAMFGTQMNLGVADTLSDLLFGLAGGMLVIVAAGEGQDARKVREAANQTATKRSY